MAMGRMHGLFRQEVFTTGQIAEICQVAPRTVSKWFDSGKLRGYRIPASNHRRIPRETLFRFLSENNMTIWLDKLKEAVSRLIILCGLDQNMTAQLHTVLSKIGGLLVSEVADLFSLGTMCAVERVGVVLVDLSLGRGACVQAACRISRLETCSDAALLAISCEDESDADSLILPAGPFHKVFTRPFDVAVVSEHILTTLES